LGTPVVPAAVPRGALALAVIARAVMVASRLAATRLVATPGTVAAAVPVAVPRQATQPEATVAMPHRLRRVSLPPRSIPTP
jgi:hypothetical protein